MIRTVFPFCVLIIAAFVSRPDDKNMLDRFFVKMKTPVRIDRDEDSRELSKSYADPNRYDHIKLFPGTHLEFDKWDRVDGIGFVISIAAVAGVIGLLFLIVSIGG